MSPHPLANFEIKGNYQNEQRSNGVYQINNLPVAPTRAAQIKYRTYAINLVACKPVGTQ